MMDNLNNMLGGGKDNIALAITPQGTVQAGETYYACHMLSIQNHVRYI